MNQSFKKLLKNTGALALALVMVLSLFPAVAFAAEEGRTLTATAAGVTVTVTEKEGTLPGGTELAVSALDKDAAAKYLDAAGLTSGIALDVKLKTAAGDDYQLEGQTVRLSFVGDGIDANARVWHFPAEKASDNAAKGGEEQPSMRKRLMAAPPAAAAADAEVGTPETPEAAFENGALSVDATHFSVYLINGGTTLTEPRRTYKFEDIDSNGNYVAYQFYNKAGKLVDNQIIKNGDALEDVGTPYHSGFDFKGWFLWDGSNWGAEVKINGTAITGITADETVTVRAMYGNAYYLYFNENAYTATEKIILTTCVVLAGESYPINNVTAPIPSAGWVFTGWAVDDATTIEASPFKPIADTQLYPIFKKVYWLRFIGNGVGASYTEAKSFFEGQELSASDRPNNPTREGFTFDDWYTEAEGGSVFSWSGTLSGDTSIYAHWNGNPSVEYKVYYWLENPNDDGYAFLTYMTKTGTAGADTVAAGLTPSEQNSHTNVNWDGFVLQEIEQQEIKGDGSTVVNVYYNRKIVTLTFYTNGAVDPYTVDPNGKYYKASRSDGNDRPRYYYKSGTGETYEDFATVTNTYFQYKDPTEGPLAYVVDGDPNVIPLYTRTERLDVTWIDLGLISIPIPTIVYDYTLSTSVTGQITRYSRSGSGDIITITDKYGADIHDKWPPNPDNESKWYDNPYGSGEWAVMLSTMPVSDKSFYYVRSSGGWYTLRTSYKTQDLDDPNHFTEYVSTSYKSNDTRINKTVDDFTAISGFSINAASVNDRDQIRQHGDPNATYDTNYSRSCAIGASYSSGEHDGNTYTLTFYYLRNRYNIDFISNGTPVKQKTDIYFGADISGYVPTDYIYNKTEAFINGANCTFQGWYDNANCEGLPYQFAGATMPDRHLTLYAKWEPSWYTFTVDPNGGVLNDGDPTVTADSTWFWRQYGSYASEYITTRDFVEDSDGTYYYHKQIDYNDPSELRLAYYTENELESTDDGKKYSKEIGAYVFEGWYELKDDGSLADKPFDFKSTPITKNTTIQAKWRRMGAYTLAYQGMVEVDDGNQIGGTAAPDNSAYANGAEITLPAAPSGITPQYVFDGWEVVDTSKATLDDNGGNYYKAGAKLTLNAAWADRNKVIHIQAHYTNVTESTDPIGVTVLNLDANGGTVNGTADDFKFTDANGNEAAPTIADNVVSYTALPLNQSFDLSTVQSKFSRTGGYVLLGWAKTAGAETPDFQLTDIIGVDNEGISDTAGTAASSGNTLYGVWKEVIEIEVEITGSTKTITYSGAEQSNPDYTVSYKVGGQSADLPAGFTMTATAVQDNTQLTTIAATGTDAGTYTATVTATLTGSAEGYTIKTASASADIVLVIQPAEVTLTANSDTVTYNGKEQTLEGFTCSVEGLTFANVTASGSGTDVDEYDVTFTGVTLAQFDQAGALTNPEDATHDSTGNYVVTKTVDGTLTIEPAEVTLTANSDTVTYTGKEQTVEGFTCSVEGLTFEKVSASGSGTEIGEYAVTFTGVTLNQTTDSTGNYVVTKTVDGKLTITNKPVVKITIKIDDKTKTYGDADPEFTATVTGLEEAGLTEADLSYTLVRESGENVGKYEITADFGGAEEDDNPENDSGTQQNDDDPTVGRRGADAANGTQDDAGQQSAYEIDYDVEVGYLTIEPAEVTVTAEDKTKDYGEADPEFTATVEGLKLQDKESVISYKLSRESGEEPGDYTITPAGDKKQGNYTVTYKTGKLTIEKGEEETGPHLTILKETTSKTPNEGYDLGDVITYKITVTNAGDQTITDITVTDELTGDEWTIKSLAPGENKVFEDVEHTVTEEDILAGEVVNVATATGTSPDPDNPDVPVDPGEAPAPTVEKKYSLTVDKETTSKPANGQYYVLGEEITYKITVTNDGNQTLKDITVTDELVNKEWKLDSLAPGESKAFDDAKHEVTEEDIQAGQVVNKATATGKTNDPENPEVVDAKEADSTDPTNPESPLKLEKVTTSKPTKRNGYEVGDQITYKITITNEGNLPITNIVVKDDLTKKEWKLDSLAPGASEDFTTDYTVTEADARKGSVTNVATAEGQIDDSGNPVKVKTEGERTETVIKPGRPFNPPKPSSDLNYDDHVAYIIGFDDGNFHPDETLTRAQTATMIYRLLTKERQEEIFTTENNFIDVDASKWYNDYVSSMVNGGYIVGYPDGTFRGDSPITRAEFITILVRFFGLANVDCVFSDIPETHWAYKYIATATSYGWINGYEDDTFRPDRSLSRAEAVTVINRMLNRGVDATSNLSGNVRIFPDTANPAMWYYYEIIEAANSHEYTGHRPNENWK